MLFKRSDSTFTKLIKYKMRFTSNIALAAAFAKTSEAIKINTTSKSEATAECQTGNCTELTCDYNLERLLSGNNDIYYSEYSNSTQMFNDPVFPASNSSLFW